MPDCLYILCGGKGARLGAITKNVPKPLIKINGEPFISSLIRAYAERFDSIVLLAGYKGRDFLKLEDEKIKVVIESEPRGTGGALTAIWNELPDSFFICNGDTFLYPLEIGPFLDMCAKKGESAILISKDEKKARGSVKVELGRAVDFEEKAGEGEGHAYTGFAFLKKSDLAPWKDKTALSLEKDVFPILAKEGKLLAQITNSRIHDIGTAAGIRKFKVLVLGTELEKG